MTQQINLYHGNILIGTIASIATEDDEEYNGIITFTPEGETYRHVFEFLANDDPSNPGAELPFEETYLDDWFIEKEEGTMQEIAIPTINFDECEVVWQE
ncbi:MAG: hypothetical protein WC028_16865 [Candidatus Obscuribacterales bacterium]|jgi:hypothetical protein